MTRQERIAYLLSELLARAQARYANGDEQGADELLAQRERMEAMKSAKRQVIEALEDARKALEHLPQDCLGIAGEVAGVTASGWPEYETWPIRDELIDKISKAIEAAKGLVEP